MLRCFDPGHPVRGIAEMAEELSVGRSTAHRYACTLVKLGYLEQEPSRKYRLSASVSNFGLALLDSMVVRRVARERLRDLRARTGRTVSLGVLGGSEVAQIDRWRGSRQGQYAVDAGLGVGTRLPLHCSAAGKALLASLPVAEQRNLTSKLRLVRRTHKTITTKTALRVELERIREQGGIAAEDEELLAGRRALAAVVMDPEGRPAAAIELAAPAEAYTCREMLEQLGVDMTIAAQRIAEGLQ